MLICLHGNPTQGQEFDPIVPLLQKLDLNPVIHKRPIKGGKLEPLLQSINATAKVSGGGSFGLVGYSWGAYLAMAYLNRFPENVTGVLLINPMLKEREPQPIPSRFFLRAPLIRSIVLKFRARSLAAAFINRTFQPEAVTKEAQLSLEPFLSQAAVWKGGEAYKKLMHLNPLPETLNPISVPVRALFGECDQMADPREHRPILERYRIAEEIIVPQAGHALPWTHTDLIVEEASRLFGR